MSATWEGVTCALWTPTDANGQLIESALGINIQFVKSRGVGGLLALGSTGEFPHLEPALRKRLIEKVATLASPLRLMINISDICPGVVADLGRVAREAGAVAVSVLPPYFYPLAQEDLVEFFVRAGDAARLPLFLYNFPERTGNRIALETLAAVADRVQVAGVKQSGGEFGYHGELVELGRKRGWVVLTGADTRLPEAVALGVSGCVSGLANAVPELVVQAWKEAAKGGTMPAADRLTELARCTGSLAFPLDVAAVMAARGLEAGAAKSIRSAATESRYRRVVEELQDLFRQWRLA